MDPMFLFRLDLRGTFEGRPGEKLAAALPTGASDGVDDRLRKYRVWDGVLYWLTASIARA